MQHVGEGLRFLKPVLGGEVLHCTPVGRVNVNGLLIDFLIADILTYDSKTSTSVINNINNSCCHRGAAAPVS